MTQASRLYWQAKIWGLLHDPPLKALRPAQRFGDEGPWADLACMADWHSPKKDRANSPLQGKWLEQINLSDLIASASDRASIGRLNQIPVQYDRNDGLEIRHLLSGASQTLQFAERPDRRAADALQQLEIDAIPQAIRESRDARKVFWWLWRCYPVAIAHALGDEKSHLLPAETRLPDGSLWSHTAMTAAIAGGLAGRYPKDENYPQKHATNVPESRPQVLSFTFTPVQDFVVASRKLRDLWAGSWTLHYLSARACWDLAWTYGPDVLLYPCLYAQPLIDLWLLEKYSDFSEWIDPPSDRALLTAGFPNVIAAILPDNGRTPKDGNSPLEAAAQQLSQSVTGHWRAIGQEALDFLQRGGNGQSSWSQGDRGLWDRWIASQWQPYWVAFPIGDPNQPLDQSPRKADPYQAWCEAQNDLTGLTRDNKSLLQPAEQTFVEQVFGLITDEGETATNPPQPSRASYRQPNLNVGSWWGYLFDATRAGLTAVKNARVWQLPTAFGPRSTISGFGPVMRSPNNSKNPNWATEDETRKFWTTPFGLFDGSEQLNPSETAKRVLPRILEQPTILGKRDENWRETVYQPDLSAGAAGWLRSRLEADDLDAIDRYSQACQHILNSFNWAQEAGDTPWGIPWIDDAPAGSDRALWQNAHNPRLLNAGWLVDDYPHEQERAAIREEIRKQVAQFFPGNNPTDWYAIAQGDGDGMGEWLKGTKLEPYKHYLPQALIGELDRLDSKTREAFKNFIETGKRMGPATHAALSRSLLDFSNQLVPYLTEDRYAGRLIYSGGDDVLAYTNLWEWDRWLWDIRQCFRGGEDPQGEFENTGHYWRGKADKVPHDLTQRPFFTLGQEATISFGLVLANQGIPLAIALQHLREAEEAAKDHGYWVEKDDKSHHYQKNAVQVRVLYQNGNILTATAKFETFKTWRSLLDFDGPEPALFEQAAEVWQQHPAPVADAIAPWTAGFCSRRDALADDTADQFQKALGETIVALYQTTAEKDRDREIRNWLKLAAFVLRKRHIKVPAQGSTQAATKITGNLGGQAA
ncbi:MAG: type III-B CRISPR-associated protein Cas10/Cmr2 [Cyanobacteria bacterium]|nr:type III-B CRISPR-associated protein Cas10/Cmr2 [Cyanobacteriota bacterium]